MTSQTANSDQEIKRLVGAITDFLRDQLTIRTDLDKVSLENAIQCLKMAYDLDGTEYIQGRFSRPLIDIFSQVTNPVKIKNKIRADAHKEVGNNNMRRCMFNDAESEYTNAIELDKWNSIYYCARAGARIEQRNYVGAIDDCRQALMLNPDYEKAHTKMGEAYNLINRPREALQCFRQALQLEPDDERYRYNRRVAEYQTCKQQIENLIESLSELRTPESEERGSNISPTSLVIIADNRPPALGTSSQNAEIADNFQNIAICENDIYGYKAEFEERSGSANNGDTEEEEFIKNILPFKFGFITPTKPLSSPSESNSEKFENVDQSLIGKTQNNTQNQVTHTCEGKQTEVKNSNTAKEAHVVYKQKNNCSRNSTKEELLAEVNETLTDCGKKVYEKDGTLLYNINYSSNNNLNEQQSGANKYVNTSYNGFSSTEKSRDTPKSVSPGTESRNVDGCEKNFSNGEGVD